MKKRPSARLLIVNRQQRGETFPDAAAQRQRGAGRRVFFTIEVSDHEIDFAGWSENERRVSDQSAWWTREQLRRSKERGFPDNIAERLSAFISAKRITPI